MRWRIVSSSHCNARTYNLNNLQRIFLHINFFLFISYFSDLLFKFFIYSIRTPCTLFYAIRVNSSEGKNKSNTYMQLLQIEIFVQRFKAIQSLRSNLERIFFFFFLLIDRKKYSQFPIVSWKVGSRDHDATTRDASCNKRYSLWFQLFHSYRCFIRVSDVFRTKRTFAILVHDFSNITD